MIKTISFFASLFICGILSAQVVSISPAFATQNDTVEIIFDASQGNMDLMGANTTVYAHTGVVLDGPNSTNWQNVQGTWGTDDNKVKMTSIGNNRYFMKFHIPVFYGLSPGDVVYRLSFVFRNVDGSLVGRNADGSDIFVPIYQAGFQSSIILPNQFAIYNVTDTLEVEALSSSNADLSLKLDGQTLVQFPDTSNISYRIALIDFGIGNKEVILQAVHNGQVFTDTLKYLARIGNNIAADLRNGEEGLTIVGDSSIYLKLRAPFKEYVYLIGDFNNWDFSADFEMFKSPDSTFFWIEIDHLDPNEEYAFQYYVGAEGLRIADPYSEKILDPWNDQYIPEQIFPNLKSYPSGKTDFPVSCFSINEDEYVWANSDFQKPEAQDLIIYKLLIRDFDQEHSYQSIIQRLDYLDSLGVNAIELMPIMEFEGNESWGYNPMFFMAPDKYYGSKNDFKELVDSCHSRGIAVILDIAMNHAFGQCPLVRMYFDPSAGQFGQPTAESPWFNQVAKHDFNVGYDFNHEAEATKYFTKRVFQHWVEEYKIDGYRVDLSKGFTQTNTLGDVNAWGQFDTQRIETLTRIKNEVEEKDSNAYMILEHFAHNPEELELSNRGFMLWANANHEYNEATMAYPGSLGAVDYKLRSWAKPGLVGFMESHDEERLMYKNLNFGNSNAGYNTKDKSTALNRMGLAAAFFFTIPGPKMLWQFGEYGYDYSINYCPDGTINPDCRISNKPIRWDYLEEAERLDLFKKYRDLIHLRQSFPNIFRTENTFPSLSSSQKYYRLENNDSTILIAGNFAMLSSNMTLEFAQSSVWYDYFSGDSIPTNGDIDTIFAPGEYHIYSNFKTSISNQLDSNRISSLDTSYGSFASVFPNPANDKLSFLLDLAKEDFVFIHISNPQGKVLLERKFYNQPQGFSQIEISKYLKMDQLANGLYYYSINSSKQNQSGSFLILK